MSTRGSVAWREKDGSWKGVYNHSDSYPTYLGAEVWKRLKELGADAVVRRLKSVGDWREFDGGGVCEYCGKVAGQPHSIRGDIYLAASKPEAKRSGFPDPQAKYHAHGDGKEDQFDPRQDPLFIEWVSTSLNRSAAWWRFGICSRPTEGRPI